MGLQKRISLALTSVIILFVVAQGYLAYSSLEEQEDDLVDEIVMTETRRLIERLQSEPGAAGAADQPIQLGPSLTAWLSPATGARTPFVPEHLSGLAEGAHRLHQGESIYHALIEQIPQGRLFVQYDASRNEEFVYRFGRYLAVSGALCILLGGLMSSFLARIVVAPFRRMSERLRNRSAGEASGNTRYSDEETMLLQAFDDAQRQLEASLVREREFAANVRHEVRTPLAALRTDAEMILLTESVSTPSEQRLRRMMVAVDSVSGGLDGLHALSRAAPGANEAVPLAQCVDEVWESLGHIAANSGATLVNEVPRTDTVDLDRTALVTILRNLLRNVIEHASPGACRVCRTAAGLRVADEGPGIPPQERSFVFDRYFQGRLMDSSSVARPDKGLGLAIARQTADLRGWALELDDASSGRGTAFNLSFS